MADLDVSKSTTTSLNGSYDDYSPDHETTDAAHGNGETKHYFSNAAEHLGYYKQIPELKKAIDGLATWVIGKGVKADTRTEVILERIRGWGEDTFLSVMWNMFCQKKIYGDCFAEITRDEQDNILNIKPLNPAKMVIVTNSKGIVKRYEQITNADGKEARRTFTPEKIFHSCNDRIADEIHGTSVIDAVKWVIDARNEAMRDYRTVLHRNVIPVRIIEIDTENEAKRDAMIKQYQDAIKNGEVLVIPKGTVEMKDNSITIQDPISWIRYLENFFYIAVGIPKVIVGGSEEFTEASSKIGYLTFEQNYNWEHSQLEADLYNQLGLKVQFNKPASLKDELLSSEDKNTGQTGFQPSETKATVTRNE